MSRGDLLFSSGHLDTALQHQLNLMREEVDSVPAEHVITADDDPWAEALAEKFRANVPDLQTDKLWMDQSEEIRLDVSGDPSRVWGYETGPVEVPGHRVVVHIPFIGDRAILQLQPNSFTTTKPRAVLRGDELVHVIEYPDGSPVDIRASADGLINQVERYLGWARSDVAPFNANLAGHAHEMIQERRNRIARGRQQVELSGIPIGPPEAVGKRVIQDAIVRRPAPVLPVSKPDAPPIQLDPVLADEVFEHILGLIRTTSVEMSRAPGSYASMDEEGRRNVLLIPLNAVYRGKGSAEAFNFQGKTDILVRHEDRNLFVGECKFWSGQKDFTDAIDQLFRYRTWRDTKLALIVFVRERGLTEITERARESLVAHPQFVEEHTASTEMELRAKVSWPGDERRLADLNVFLVHVPT